VPSLPTTTPAASLAMRTAEARSAPGCKQHTECRDHRVARAGHVVDFARDRGMSSAPAAV
jgi:hypothetical protein